jgi:hypothetical protein
LEQKISASYVEPICVMLSKKSKTTRKNNIDKRRRIFWLAIQDLI